jgi:transposase
MEVVVVVGAGLDVHKKSVVACCLDGRSTPPKLVTCTFGTFRDELERLCAWLLKRECTHVAMESTGVYWLPVYEALEGQFEIVLGNPRHIANVPGRKTDVTDAEWLAKLLRHGLIQKNFVPPQPIRQLRQITRYRRKLMQTRTACLLRVDKLLQCATIKLSSVASDIFGVSGRLMLDALSQGVTDPVLLSDLAKGTLRGKRGALMRAFRGRMNRETSSLLRIELKVITDLELQITHLDTLIRKNAEPFREIIDLLDTIPGVNETLATDMVAEIGADMSNWPTDRQFAAWTGTCPGNRESAGVRRRAHTRDGNPYVKAILIQAAVCARQTLGSHLAARYHRLAARRGPRRAAVAIAREIAVAVYHIISDHLPYRAPRQPDPQTAKDHRTKQLLLELKKLGYEVNATPIAI